MCCPTCCRAADLGTHDYCHDCNDSAGCASTFTDDHLLDQTRYQYRRSYGGDSGEYGREGKEAEKQAWAPATQELARWEEPSEKNDDGMARNQKDVSSKENRTQLHEPNVKKVKSDKENRQIPEEKASAKEKQ